MNPWRIPPSRHSDPQRLLFHLLLLEWADELWPVTTQTGLSVKKSSLNDWNISDALPDKRSKNKSVEWEAGEFPLTLWSTRKWEGLIPVYTDLTQQLLSAGVINTSTRRILLSPGDNTTPRAWPHRWRQTWPDNFTVGETDRDVKRSTRSHKDKSLSYAGSVILLAVFIYSIKVRTFFTRGFYHGKNLHSQNDIWHLVRPGQEMTNPTTVLKLAIDNFLINDYLTIT